MGTLELLQARHAPVSPEDPQPEPEPVAPIEISSWRDSDSVVALSEYLKTCSGTSLVELDGCPCLHFDPAVTPAEHDRWQAAIEAGRLMEAARDDLLHLFELDVLQLNPHPGFAR